MKKIYFLVVASCLLSLGTLRAEPTRWSIAVQPGYAIVIGNLRNIFSDSFSLQASVDYQFHEWVSGGLELGATFANKLQGTFKDNPQFGTINFTSDVSYKLYQMTPILRIGRPIEVSGIKLKPYGAIGLGLYADRANAGTLTIPSGPAAGTSPIAEAKLVGHFGFNVGAGFDSELWKGFCIGADFRYHRYYSDVDLNADDHLDRKTVEYWTPSLRLAYRF